MPMYFFAIPPLDPGPAEHELNGFCAAQRAVARLNGALAYT